MPVGAIKPELYDAIDVDAAARAIASAFGAPTSLLKPAAEVAAAREANAQQAMIEGMLGAAGPATGALKNLAQAGQAGASVLGGEGLAAMIGNLARNAAPNDAAASNG